MVYRAPRAAPQSLVPEPRRGHLIGRYCHGCNQVFPLQRRLHSGDPIYGRDHVGSTCPYEGADFEPGADWWEPAIDMLPAPPPPAEASAGAANVGATAAAAPPAQPQTTNAPQQGQPAPAPVQPPPKP
jgi:hypothetical protein